MKIKTYAVNCNDAWLNTEGDDISRSYVKYKDHQEVVSALEAKCAALLDELDKWKQESSAWQAVAEKQLALATNAEQKISELESLTAQQLPQQAMVVPDEMTPKQASRSYCGEVRGYRDGWNACRARIVGNTLLADMDRAATRKLQELTTDNTAQQFESLSRGDK